MRSIRPLLISAVTFSTLAGSLLAGCGVQGPNSHPALQAPARAPQAQALAKGKARALDARAARAVESLRSTYARLDTFTATAVFWEQFGPDTETNKAQIVMAKPGKIRADIVESTDFLKRGAKMVYLGDKKITVKRAFIKKTYAYDDFAVRSFRGWRIDQSDFAAVVASVLADEAVVKTVGAETIGGHACDVVEVVSSALLPGTDREVVALDRETSVPLRLEAYVGKDVVYRYELSDVKLNPALTPETFSL